MNEAYDYIVVGAGSAGCVMAARLSEDPAVRVLLIEEGPAKPSFLVDMPKGFGVLLTKPERAHLHPLTVEPNGTDRVQNVWARGKMLGGSSAINGMVWVRGQPQDYDRIAEYGNPGWSWAEVAPYFKRLENHTLGGDELRGTGGPITITDNPNKNALAEAFIAAGTQLGLPVKRDQNRLEQEGIGYLQWNIDQKGKRVSAARGFLDPIKGRANLTIESGVRSDRVLFESKRAVGVEGVRDGVPVTFQCRGEVILCAGGLGSPRILQLSGIGPAAVLQAAGIPLLVDSPRIGYNMREHSLMALNYRIRDWRYSQNRSYTPPRLFGNLLRYLATGKGPLAWGSHELAAFVRADEQSSRPDSQIMFGSFSFDRVDEGVAFEKEPGIHVFAYPLRPTSEGSILVTSNDPAVPPAIRPNYFDTEYDRRISVAAIRYIRRLMAQSPLREFLVGETERTAGAQTDEEILAAFRRYGEAGYHACGTVAMGSGQPLDERLRVRGVDGLRVMDCSIYPEMLSGNTNAPTMALAWRAADLILQERHGE